MHRLNIYPTIGDPFVIENVTEWEYGGGLFKATTVEGVRHLMAQSYILRIVAIPISNLPKKPKK